MEAGSVEAGAVEAIRAPWDGVALVCRKCGKKLDGGFGPKGRDSLRDVLRAALRGAGRRRALKVLEVKCLGLCPKGAVTVIGPHAPGQVLAVKRGTSGEAVLAALG